MEKENVSDKEKLQHDNINSNEQISSDDHSTKNDQASVNNVVDSDLNKSKKGHITNLNEKIVKTERDIEDMNESIMGQSIFDY